MNLVKNFNNRRIRRQSFVRVSQLLKVLLKNMETPKFYYQEEAHQSIFIKKLQSRN